MSILSKFPQFNTDSYDGHKMRIFVDMLGRTISQINSLLYAKKFNVRARRTTTQAISNTTATVVQYVTEDWDNDNVFNVSNYRYTPGITGYYQFAAQAVLTSLANGSYVLLSLRKNGSNEVTGLKNYNTTGGASDTGSFVSGVIFLDENDYIDVTIEHNNGSSRDISASSTLNYLTAYKAG